MWMDYYAKLGDLLYINGLGGIFFFFFERERVLTWHLLLMIVLYYQAKTSIDFWYKHGLNGLGRSWFYVGSFVV